MRLPIGVSKAIDRVRQNRIEQKMLKEEEEQLVTVIKEFMSTNSLETIETHTSVAEFVKRIGGAIDPEAYYEALEEDFDKFLETVSVRKETNKKNGNVGADYYLSKEKIEEICVPTETTVLYVKALQRKKTAPIATQVVGRTMTA
jgi:hypothetical protein